MRSLRAKLAVLLLLLYGAAAALALFVTLRGADAYSDEVNHRLNRGVAEHLAKSVQPFSGEEADVDEESLKGLFMHVMAVNPSLEVYLLDPDGKLLAYDAPEEKIYRRRVDTAPIAAYLAAGGEQLVRGDDPRSLSGAKPISVAPVVVAGVPRGYLYVVLGGEAFESATAALTQGRILRLGTVALLAGFAASWLCGWFALRQLTRPLERLRGAVRRFRETGEATPLPGAAADEVGALTRDFESMAERIAAQVKDLAETDERRREFVANISHDLRTPTAAVQGYLETLRHKATRLSVEERERCLAGAQRQAERLARLVDQLFELAQLEAREALPQKEDFNLAELVQDVVQKFQGPASDNGVLLSAVLQPDVPSVHGDIGLIERALDNLIDNALRHTPGGSAVRVRLARRAGRVVLRVEDEGPGIPSRELPHLFERFHQVDCTADADGGAGLGLAITRRIVDLHGGQLAVESEVDVGSTFRIELEAHVADESARDRKSEEVVNSA